MAPMDLLHNLNGTAYWIFINFRKICFKHLTRSSTIFSLRCYFFTKMLAGRPLGGVHFGEIVVLFQASGNTAKESSVDPGFLVLRS